MNIELYNFPIDRVDIEQQYCELLNKYRSGEKLEPEVIDWMDQANNFLMSTSNEQ